MRVRYVRNYETHARDHDRLSGDYWFLSCPRARWIWKCSRPGAYHAGVGKRITPPANSAGCYPGRSAEAGYSRRPRMAPPRERECGCLSRDGQSISGERTTDPGARAGNLTLGTYTHRATSGAALRSTLVNVLRRNRRVSPRFPRRSLKAKQTDALAFQSDSHVTLTAPLAGDPHRFATDGLYRIASLPAGVHICCSPLSPSRRSGSRVSRSQRAGRPAGCAVTAGRPARRHHRSEWARVDGARLS